MTIPDQEMLAGELTELIQSQVLETSEPLHAESDLFAAGLDSMAMMQLLLLIEQRYGVMLPASDLTTEHFGRPTDIAKLLRVRLGEQAAGEGSVGDGE
ncbi:acyl carrier protein [Phycisphaerales bacterium AB-hyl4]|uniref:Acyl carrier protein n=1 Tax=Natronomicrosphaera hydrolytica TaxID=3242702 RepID=A0ABV4U4A5_9BACT